VREESLPQKGLSAIPLVGAVREGKIKGLLSVCFDPIVSLPDANFVREALEKLEFYTNIDSFLSEMARYADVVFAGSLMEENHGTTTSVEERVIRHCKPVTPPRDAREDWQIICEIATRLAHGDKFRYDSPRDIFEQLRIASKGGASDYYGTTWERIEESHGLFWPCPEIGHPGTPRLYENGKFGRPETAFIDARGTLNSASREASCIQRNISKRFYPLRWAEGLWHTIEVVPFQGSSLAMALLVQLPCGS